MSRGRGKWRRRCGHTSVCGGVGESGGLRESMVQGPEAIVRAWIGLCKLESCVISGSLRLLAGEDSSWAWAAVGRPVRKLFQ